MGSQSYLSNNVEIHFPFTMLVFALMVVKPGTLGISRLMTPKSMRIPLLLGGDLGELEVGVWELTWF